jgi:hypothetical protein
MTPPYSPPFPLQLPLFFTHSNCPRPKESLTEALRSHRRASLIPATPGYPASISWYQSPPLARAHLPGPLFRLNSQPTTAAEAHRWQEFLRLLPSTVPGSPQVTGPRCWLPLVTAPLVDLFSDTGDHRSTSVDLRRSTMPPDLHLRWPSRIVSSSLSLPALRFHINGHGLIG